MHFSKKIIGLTSGMVLLGLWWFKSHLTQPSVAPAIPVRVATVQQKEMPRLIRQVGTVVANESVAIRARIDSQIMDIGFQDGATVPRGALLFQLDDREIRSQLAQAQATLLKDRALSRNAQAQYERAERLWAQKFSSKADFDQAKATAEAQEAQVKWDEAQVQDLKTQLSYTQIKAPIQGRTGLIGFTVGNTVKANDLPLVTMNQIQPIRVQSALSQNDLDPLRQAMKAGKVPVLVHSETDPQPLTGFLAYLDNHLDISSGTFAVQALLPNEAESLWPGMLVTLEIHLSVDTDVVTIPEVAIQHDPAGDYVYLLEHQKALRRPVQVARLQQGQAIIQSGLRKGEQIIVDGFLFLKEGSTVTAQPESFS